MTLRLRVTDAQGRVGEDRRAFFARDDESLMAGFPKRIGPGGEGQAVLADLTGSGRLDIIFGDTDGRVHAIDPVSGRERTGFPVKTESTKVQRAHEGVAPGNEPIVTNVAVGDLAGTGALKIVGTTTTGRTYIWGERGRRRSGWPKTLDTGVVPAPIPRPDLEKTRKPARGARVGYGHHRRRSPASGSGQPDRELRARLRRPHRRDTSRVSLRA
nr:hypothetical protein [Actinomycetota bacterium]